MKFSTILVAGLAAVVSATPSATSSSSVTACPSWTGGTAAPAYFTNLPSSIKSALPSWSGAPPSDYCLYTSWMENFSSCSATPSSTLGLATGSGSGGASVATYTGTAPIASFTGAANAKSASYAFAGLAAAAVLAMA